VWCNQAGFEFGSCAISALVLARIWYLNHLTHGYKLRCRFVSEKACLNNTRDFPNMASFQAPNFQERAEAAKQAKLKALEKLKNKPPVDPAIIELRKIAEAVREASQEAKRQAKKAEQAQKEAEKAARKQAEIEAAAEAEKARMQKEIMDKLARDERYAARKVRKGGK
jgi:Family of unknown function (DUF6481)